MRSLLLSVFDAVLVITFNVLVVIVVVLAAVACARGVAAAVDAVCSKLLFLSVLPLGQSLTETKRTQTKQPIYGMSLMLSQAAAHKCAQWSNSN